MVMSVLQGEVGVSVQLEKSHPACILLQRHDRQTKLSARRQYVRYLSCICACGRYMGGSLHGLAQDGVVYGKDRLPSYMVYKREVDFQI